MKFIYLFLFVILGFGPLFGQNTGTIRGTIKTSDGSPAEFVNVGIQGTAKGTVAGRNGHFEIAKVPAGSHVVTASFVGLESQQQTVEVKAGEVITVDFTLNENAEKLQEVVVSSGRLVGESFYVSRMPLKNIENMQVYNTVSSDVLKQQAVTTYEDAFRNVPGIFKLWESTGRSSGDGSALFAMRGFQTQATMINGLPGLTNGSLDPSNIDHIEVIKGPSSTLFGSSLISYGGLINTVTKKPYQTFGGEVSYQAGSYGLNRVTADFNTPLNKEGENEVLFRVNTAYHSENSFQDAGFRKSFFIAPTLSFKASDRLSFLISTEFMQEEKTNQTMIFLGRFDPPLDYHNLSDLNYNNKLSFTSNDLSIKNPRYNLQAQATYKISGHWTSQTAISRGTARSDGYYTYIFDNEDGATFGLWANKQQGQTTTTDIQQNFIGDFQIGGMRNRLTVGLDYFNRNIIDNGSGWNSLYSVTMQGQITYGPTEYYLTRSSVDAALASTGRANTNSKDATYSAYASNVLNITPQLLAMASLRVDHFDTEGDITTDGDDYDQTTLSPKFGLLYQPVANKLSVFANYMNGFQNSAPRTAFDPDGKSNPRVKTFKPEHAEQFEVGAKANLLADLLTATVSYYDIKVANMITMLTENQYDYNQRGEVESKGFEFDLNASPVAGLSLIAGYSHNDSKVIEGLESDLFLPKGYRPGSAGPKDLVNFWANYTFQSGSLNGWGIGFGGNYFSKNEIMTNPVTGGFTLPSYTIMNASVSYTAAQFRVALNVNNVTDKEWYLGYSTVNPQKPRTAVLSLSYKF